MKKGVSSIISAVILIGIVLAASATYFLWIKDVIARAQLQTLDEKKCFDSSVEVSDFCLEKSEIMNIQTGVLEEKTRIQFNAMNKNQEVPIIGFMIRLDYNSGSSSAISSIIGNEVENLIAKKIISDFIQNSEDIKKIDIFPKISYENNKTVICDKKGIYFYWEAIKQC